MNYPTSYEQEHFEDLQQQIQEKISKLEEAQEAIAEAIDNINHVLKDHDYDMDHITNDLDNLHSILEDEKDNLRP